MKSVEEKLELAEEYKEEALIKIKDLLEGYKNGYESAEKKIKDKINALKSKLTEEKRQKLTKTINQERVKELEAQIKILQGLL